MYHPPLKSGKIIYLGIIKKGMEKEIMKGRKDGFV